MRLYRVDYVNGTERRVRVTRMEHIEVEVAGVRYKLDESRDTRSLRVRVAGGVHCDALIADKDAGNVVQLTPVPWNWRKGVADAVPKRLPH